mmetsp:Transcript_1889/g.6734  ORF Transcript_1889/g.6734 Transcript_1889/m.6734 type:complete len:297 (-) Transcript_1889:190-1080(-)
MLGGMTHPLGLKQPAVPGGFQRAQRARSRTTTIVAGGIGGLSLGWGGGSQPGVSSRGLRSGNWKLDIINNANAAMALEESEDDGLWWGERREMERVAESHEAERVCGETIEAVRLLWPGAPECARLGPSPGEEREARMRGGVVRYLSPLPNLPKALAAAPELMDVPAPMLAARISILADVLPETDVGAFAARHPRLLLEATREGMTRVVEEIDEATFATLSMRMTRSKKEREESKKVKLRSSDDYNYAVGGTYKGTATRAQDVAARFWNLWGGNAECRKVIVGKPMTCAYATNPSP